jgi:transposase
MRGRTVDITWHEEAAALYERYRREGEPELRTRWHALWLVRQGKTVREAARLVGVHERSLQQWTAWYRQGGLPEVAQHRRGGRQGRPSHLTPAQWAAVAEQAAQGAFFTVQEAVDWAAERFGIRYRYWGMYSHLRRHGLKKKVPRPQGVKADPAAQAAWKKGGSVRR